MWEKEKKKHNNDNNNNANFVSKLGVSRRDHDPPNQPTHPISTRVQSESTLPLVGFRFSRPRPDVGRSSGGFSSPKLEPPNSTKVIYKSDKIMLKSEEIQ